MRPTSIHTKGRSSKQRGFALLLVMFLTTLMLIAVMAAAPYVRTEGQREKEQEMIWRGKQYVRGIKMFYRKNGRFPTSLDDLTKPKTGSIRFMRQPYKDPMNATDGSWRLIYVGPGGQLIGSLKPPQTFQIPVAGAGATAAAPSQTGTGFGSAAFGQSNQPQANTQTSNAGSSGQQGANASGSAATNTADASNATPSGLLSADTPLIGGNIIGVGSKVNKRSVIVYDKAKNYRLFEFVWNPSKDLANALNANGVQTAVPVQKGAAPAQGGFGQQPTQGPVNPPAGAPLPIPAPTSDQPPPQ